LTALAVGLAAGKLVPELSSGASWPWAPLDARVMAALTAAGIMLGVATIAVVLFAGS
jgi:hypothetical protein